MNVRVLLLMAACVLTSGCCMPGILMNPRMMQCCPVGSIGPRPMMSAAACAPPQFRSFHSDLVMTRLQSPQPFNGFAGFAQPALSTNVCCPAPRPVCPQPIYQQQFQPQSVCVAPPVRYAPRYCAPKASVPAKPWKLPWSFANFPKFGGGKAVSQRWIPVETHRTVSSAPCGESGCGEIGYLQEPYQSSGTSFRFEGDGCGEEVPYFSMNQQPTASLSPVPASPTDADVRYFPNSGEKRTTPVRREPANRSFDPPPAAEKLPDPPDIMLEDDDAVTNQAPASNPATTDEVNPFEDVEDLPTDSALPREAEMPQAILLVPKSNYQPLHIPASKVSSSKIVTVASETATPWIAGTQTDQATQFITSPQVIRAAESVQTTEFIQKYKKPEVISPPEMHWNAIELQEGFFGQDGSTQLRRPQQQPPVRPQATSRQVIQHRVIHRATVDEAEQLVPITRVISKRRQ